MKKGFWGGLRRHAGVWGMAWRSRHQLSGRSNRGQDEREFLPAALEIQDSPPSPAGRAILWAIMAFFVLGVIWAIVGQVDIVATAQGQIVPSGRTKTIQPMEIGVVRAIHVENGDRVAPGDVLIKLDTTVTQAEQQRLETQLIRARLKRARLRHQLTLSEREPTNEGIAPFRPPSGSPADLVQRSRQLLNARLSEYRAELAALDQSIVQQRAELASTRALLAKLKSTLPLITERAEGLKGLAVKGYVPHYNYLEVEAQRIGQTQDLAVQRSRIDRFDAAIAESKQRRLALVSGFRSTTLAELAEVDQKIASLDQELIKAGERTALKHLTAPVSGVVQQLAVHTVGGVVTPAQVLMVIVPRNETLEVKAWVQNRDIGFVYDGQRAEVKIAAFPFTRYGVVDATVVDISNAAIQDEKLGWVYAANVSLDRAFMNVHGQSVQLTPGMEVTVEIKTGKRHLIEYFLSPLLRYGNESIKER